MAAKRRTDAQLRKAMSAGYDARNELQERESARLTKKNGPMVGRLQKYSNSYGSGDRWWLYRRINSVEGRWCKAFSFQTDGNGRMEIKLDEHGSLDTKGWQDISEREFDKAWAELLAKLPGSASPKHDI